MSRLLRLSIRNLFSHKIRFAITTLVVVLGVTFVTGVFVLTDSLRTTFGELSESIEEGIDLTVRAPQDIGRSIDRDRVPEELVDVVAAVDGVKEALPAVGAPNTVVIDGDGEPIVPPGPPAFGFSWFPVQFFIVDGHEPAGPDQFVIDTTTAAEHDLRIGTTYDIAGPVERRSFTLVGTFNFGSPDENQTVGQTMAAFDLDTAQDFLGFGDTVSEIDVVVDPDADVDRVAEAIAAAVGDDYEVVTQQQKVDETRANFDEFIGVFNNILLAFALIGVFVAAFIINNTFQIVVGQRIRELGLLRALGATGSQVRDTVLLEGALVGVVSTLVGLVAGLGLSALLRFALNAGGFALPTGPLELRPRTVVFAVLVGLGVTLVASISPARRARRISPMAALQEGLVPRTAGFRTRLLVGGALVVVGAVALAFGLFGGFATVALVALLVVGALGVFIGVTIASPAFARPVVQTLGRPVARLFGVPGRLARENAARTPRRTSSTAAALMIGLALVSMAAVIGDSIRATFLDTIDNSVKAQYFLSPVNRNFDPSAGFPLEVAERLEALPEIDDVMPYRFALDSIEVAGDTKDVIATDFSSVPRHIDPQLVAGDFTTADPDHAIALHSDPARDLGVGVGDTIAVTFPDGQTDELTVAAIYDDAVILGNWAIPLAVWDRHFDRPELAFATATVAGWSDDLPDEQRQELLARSRAAIDAVMADYPTVQVENRAEFRQTQQEQLDSFLITINVFLALALFIALVGIANTLALSVFERTREIGLLRAVGATRRQIRRMVRWEAAIVAVYGALLGTVLGLAFGVATANALPEAVVTRVSVPVGTLVVYVVVAGVAGLVAALLPAWRASRLAVLEAIAYE